MTAQLDSSSASPDSFSQDSPYNTGLSNEVGGKRRRRRGNKSKKSKGGKSRKSRKKYAPITQKLRRRKSLRGIGK
jgi:hypothetical protein